MEWWEHATGAKFYECIWRTTSEQYRNKTARKNAIQKNRARAGVSETQRKESKIEKKKIVLGMLLGYLRWKKPHKNLGPIRQLHAEIVLVQKRTLFPVWRFFFKIIFWIY